MAFDVVACIVVVGNTIAHHDDVIAEQNPVIERRAQDDNYGSQYE